MAAATDGQLLSAWLYQHSEEAFACLVERHGPMVRAACIRVAGPAEADDAVQATFLVLARKARHLERRRDLGGWLHRCAVFVARRAIRQQAAWRRRERLSLMANSSNRSARIKQSYGELIPHLDAALNGLPSRYREVLVLHYLEGRTQAEVARALGKPLGTVASLCKRGLERVRRKLTLNGSPIPTSSLASLLGAEGAGIGTSVWASTIASAVVVGKASKTSALLAKGALETMMWIKMKNAAAIIVGLATLSTGMVGNTLWADEGGAPRRAPVIVAQAPDTPPSMPVTKPSLRPEPAVDAPTPMVARSNLSAPAAKGRDRDQEFLSIRRPSLPGPQEDPEKKPPRPPPPAKKPKPGPASTTRPGLGDPHPLPDPRTDDPDAQSVTLFVRKHGQDPMVGYKEATFSFEYATRDDMDLVKNDWDICLMNPRSRDWVFELDVCTVTDDESSIWDLGALPLTDVNRGTREVKHGPGAEMLPAIAGHVYLIHTKDTDSDFWAAARVDQMIPELSATISWKLLTEPQRVHLPEPDQESDPISGKEPPPGGEKE